MAGPLTFMRSQGYELSSCVYFEVQSSGNVLRTTCYIYFYVSSEKFLLSRIPSFDGYCPGRYAMALSQTFSHPEKMFT